MPTEPPEPQAAEPERSIPLQNEELGRVLNQVADLLEIEGGNDYRVRAYRNAAQNVTFYPESIAEMVAAGKDLTEIPGIGESLALKLKEIVQTGHLSYLDKVRERIPQGLRELIEIPGLGPKRVQALREGLGISNLDELEQAARAGRIRELRGFGAKSEQHLLAEIERYRERASAAITPPQPSP